MPTPSSYSKPQIYLHWLIVLLVFFQLLFDMEIGRTWHQLMDGTVSSAGTANIHVFTGIAVLVLMVIRFALRLTRGAPALPEAESKPLQLVAHAVHWGFYLVLLLIPVSGMLAWFGTLRPLGEVHEVLTKLLWALIAAHVVGALYQQFVLKTNILARMSPHG